MACADNDLAGGAVGVVGRGGSRNSTTSNASNSSGAAVRLVVSEPGVVAVGAPVIGSPDVADAVDSKKMSSTTSRTGISMTLPQVGQLARVPENSSRALSLRPQGHWTLIDMRCSPGSNDQNFTNSPRREEPVRQFTDDKATPLVKIQRTYLTFDQVFGKSMRIDRGRWRDGSTGRCRSLLTIFSARHKLCVVKLIAPHVLAGAA
jgi:hypothetical protein